MTESNFEKTLNNPVLIDAMTAYKDDGDAKTDTLDVMTEINYWVEILISKSVKHPFTGELITLADATAYALSEITARDGHIAKYADEREFEQLLEHCQSFFIDCAEYLYDGAVVPACLHDYIDICKHGYHANLKASLEYMDDDMRMYNNNQIAQVASTVGFVRAVDALHSLIGD